MDKAILSVLRQATSFEKCLLWEVLLLGTGSCVVFTVDSEELEKKGVIHVPGSTSQSDYHQP